MRAVVPVLLGLLALSCLGPAYAQIGSQPLCSGLQTLTESRGTFSDGSGTDMLYVLPMNCTWLINPPGDREIVLVFKRFMLAMSDDYLLVKDGNSGEALALYTGMMATPTAAHFRASSLLVSFVTATRGLAPPLNDFTGAQGFEVEYIADGGCYESCSGSGPWSGAGRCNDHGLCECPLLSMGADCSIGVPNVVPDGGSTMGEVFPGETRFFEVDVPANTVSLMVDLFFPEGVGQAKPLLLLGNGTGTHGESPPHLSYYQEMEGSCGGPTGCQWSPLKKEVESSASDAARFHEPVVDFETSGMLLLQAKPPAFPFGTVRVPALPTYNLNAAKDYESSEMRRGHHYIYMPATSEEGLPLLTPGRWFIGVMNQPTISGHPGGEGVLVYELRVRTQNQGAVSPNGTISNGICPLNCSGRGTCVQQSTLEMGRCACNYGYAGNACENRVSLLKAGVAIEMPPLSVGHWNYYLLDVPVGRLSQELYVEIESTSPLADPILSISGSRGSAWDGIPFPREEIRCMNVPYGTGPADNLRCSIRGYVNSTITTESRDVDIKSVVENKFHDGALVLPEEHVQMDDSTGTFWPVTSYVIGVYNSAVGGLSPLKYKIMASWYEEDGIAPCPFNCNDHGDCITSNGTCVCDLPKYVGWSCEEEAEAITLKMNAEGAEASVSGNLEVGMNAHYYLEINETQNLLVELTHGDLDAFPIVTVSKGNIPDFVSDPALKWRDDRSSWCNGVECATEYNHEVAIMNAEPGTYFISVQNSGFRLFGYWRDVFLSKSSLAKYSTPLSFSLDVKSYPAGKDAKAVKCYRDCSGHGKCNQDMAPICSCDEGFFGIDCSTEPTKLPFTLVAGNQGVTTPLSGSIRSGHHEYYSIEVPKGAKSFLVELRSNTAFQDYGGDVVLYARKDEMPVLCIREDDNFCRSQFDMTSDYSAYDPSIKNMFHSMNVNAFTVNTTDESISGNWIIGIYHGFDSNSDFQYEMIIIFEDHVMCQDPYCNGHGVCDKSVGKCSCDESHMGDQCEYTIHLLQPGTELMLQDSIAPGGNAFFVMPVNCTGQDFSLSFESATSLHHSYIVLKRGDLPLTGTSNDFDNIERADVPMALFNVDPGFFYGQLMVPMETPTPVEGLKVAWDVFPTATPNAENGCKYGSGTYYLIASGSNGPYQILDLGDLLEQNEIVMETTSGLLEWANNPQMELQLLIPPEMTEDGTIREADYGDCGATPFGCYLASIGKFTGAASVAISEVSSIQDPFFYVQNMLFKLPGNYEDQGEDIFSSLPLVYQYDGTDGGWDYEACSPLLNKDEMDGKVCIVARGSCTFYTKTKNCQDAGAIATIIVDATSPVTFDFPLASAPAGTDTSLITIPTLTIGTVMASKIMSMLSQGSSSYDGDVTLQAGLYMCESNPDQVCGTCSDYTFGENCTTHCPGLLGDFSDACSGHGTCSYNGESDPVCNCDRGFGGRTCALALDSSGSGGKMTGALVGTILASIFGIALLVVLACFFWSRGSKGKRTFFKMQDDTRQGAHEPGTPGASYADSRPSALSSLTTNGTPDSEYFSAMRMGSGSESGAGLGAGAGGGSGEIMLTTLPASTQDAGSTTKQPSST